MTSSSEKCESCGAPTPQDAICCPNCGVSRVAVTSKSPVAVTVLTAFAGVLFAIPLWLVLGAFGATLFARFGPPNVSGSEFGVSWGAAGFYILITLLALAGLVLQFRARLSTPLRGFIVAFLCVTLGLFSICDIFALSSRG